MKRTNARMRMRPAASGAKFATSVVMLLMAIGIARGGELYLQHGSYRGNSGNYVDAVVGLCVDDAGQTAMAGNYNNDDLMVYLLDRTLTNVVYSYVLGLNEGIWGWQAKLYNHTNIWVAGNTRATDMPVTANAYQPTNANGTEMLYRHDAFLMKLDATKTGSASLQYSTYLGGPDTAGWQEYCKGLAVDGAGAAYMVGICSSTSFPVTANAYQTTNAGGSDAYFAKFDSSGGVVFVSYFGGSGADQGFDVAVDGAGNIYLLLTSTSTGLPTKNAYQSSSAGNYDLYLAKFDPTGTNLLYASYFGGSGVDGWIAGGLALAPDGKVVVVGLTASANLPVKNAYMSTARGSYDLAVAKFDTTLSGADSLVFSSYYGGNDQEAYNGATGNGELGVAVDADGRIHIACTTMSTNMPIRWAYQSTLQGTRCAHVACFNASFTAPMYASYLGGSGSDRARAVAFDGSGGVYVVGETGSADFPITPNALDKVGGTDTYTEGFYARLVWTRGGTLIMIK